MPEDPEKEFWNEDAERLNRLAEKAIEKGIAIQLEDEEGEE